jgi:hypothetical protein
MDKDMRTHLLLKVAAFLGAIVIGAGVAQAQNQGNVGGGNIDDQLTTTSAGDFFQLTGRDTITGLGQGVPLQAGAWETYTLNNLIGPEVSLSLESEHGRWTFTSDFKFTAGFNWQNNIYRGANLPANTGADYLRTNFAGGGLTTVNVGVAGGGIGTGGEVVSVVSIPNSPLVTQVFPTGQVNATNDAEHRFTFSPVGEWRFGAEFRVSQAISLNFGYTGMWLSQIARASSNTAYETTVQPVQRVARNTTGAPIYVDPTGQTVSGPGQGVTEVPANGSYVKIVPGLYNQIVPQNGGNEYVFTNGIDFGMVIKY